MLQFFIFWSQYFHNFKKDANVATVFTTTSMFAYFVHCVIVDVCFTWTLTTQTIWLSQYTEYSACNSNKQRHKVSWKWCFLVLCVFVLSKIILVQYAHPHETSETLLMCRLWPVTETWVEDSKINQATNVCTVKGVYTKSSNALFEVHEKSSICLYFKDSQFFPSFCEDWLCAAQRKSVEGLGQYKGHMLSMTHRIHWA